MKKKANNDISLRESVHTRIRNDILTGKIKPGARLVESTLAEEIGVSRTPIREALHKLTLENLVYAIPRAGYIVNEITEYDIEDLFKVRTAIEAIAAKWALEKIRPEEITKLEENLKQSAMVISKGDTEKMLSLDTAFHDIICQASRSQRLYQISQTLREHMMRFRSACLHVPEIAQKATEGHAQILQAMKAKSPEMLEQAVNQHMDETQKDILDYLRQLRESSWV